MRDNGLTAAAYTDVGELEIRLLEPVLRALAEAGIAAYAEPSEGQAETRENLYVDAAATERAAEVIRRSTEAAEWASLVEQFNAEPAGDDPAPGRWPASEDVDEDAGTPELPEPPRPVLAERADDLHDHYVPPEPARGPKLDWIARLAWLGVLGGPIVLVFAAIFEVDGTSRITLAALLGFAGGFLTLVMRMKDRPPIDDTPDDGAVV